MFGFTSTPLAEKRGHEQCIGKSRGGRTTKIHARVDAEGTPRQIELTPGNYHDNACAETLLEGVEAGAIIGDKAYDADRILLLIEGPGMLAVIPPTRTRKDQEV